MTTFFGKLFASLILGVSSLFVGHPAPITVQTPVEASSTVSVSTAVATSTPVPPVTPITIPVVHSTPVKAASTPISRAVVTATVVTPPVVTTVAAPPLKCVTGKVDVDGTCQWTSSSTATIAVENQVEQYNQQQTQLQEQQNAAEEATALANAQESQQSETESADIQSFTTEMASVSTDCKNGDYMICTNAENELKQIVENEQSDGLSSQEQASELQTIQNEVNYLQGLSNGYASGGGLAPVAGSLATLYSEEATTLMADESLL